MTALCHEMPWRHDRLAIRAADQPGLPTWSGRQACRTGPMPGSASFFRCCSVITACARR